MNNITPFPRQQREREQDKLRQNLDGVEAGTTGAGGGDGQPPTTGDWPGWRVSVDARLEALKGAIDGLRWSFTLVVGVIVAVMIGGFGFFGLQLTRLEGRIDRLEVAIQAIPMRLSEEFHAMRSEMAAQTSAIANSITATRQAQPPAPQIIVVPAPQPPEKPAKPQ